MSDPFQDSRAKLDRGKAQLDALYAQILEALHADEVIADVEFDAERPEPPVLPDGTLLRIATFKVIHAPVIPRNSGLLVGEVLHNFRSALDHTAWSLVKHTGHRNLTRPQAREVAFPMAKKRANLNSLWNSKLRGVPQTPYFGIVDDFQPYRRTAAGRAMRSLRNLSDTDKHRLLVPALAFPYKVDLKIEVKPPWALLGHKELLALHRPVKVGTKLASILLVRLPPGQTSVDAHGNFQVYPELPGRLGLEATMNAIRDACSDCIERIAAAL